MQYDVLLRVVGKDPKRNVEPSEDKWMNLFYDLQHIQSYYAWLARPAAVAQMHSAAGAPFSLQVTYKKWDSWDPSGCTRTLSYTIIPLYG